MNRGINDQKDLPEDYLGKIYDEISEREIRMKAIPPAKPKQSVAATANAKQRKLIHNMEMHQVRKIYFSYRSHISVDVINLFQESTIITTLFCKRAIP